MTLAKDYNWEVFDTQALLAYWSGIEQAEANYRSAKAKIEFVLKQRKEAPVPEQPDRRK